MPSKLRTWLQLFRAPNLFTVPGDPLAGYVLAAFGAFESEVFYAVGASLCFYAAGLLDNDLADLAEDRAERPQRPLPSGAASPRAVGTVAIGLVVLGFFLAGKLGATAVSVSAALVVAVAIYNHRTKHAPVLGALNMGACRGLSVLLGAAAAPHSHLLWRLIAARRLDHLVIAVALVTFYIAAVTNLARFETKAAAPRAAKWLPLLVLLVGVPAFLAQLNGVILWSNAAETWHVTNLEMTAGTFAVVIISAFAAALHLARNPAAPVPPVIGDFIRLLLLIQTAFCIPAATNWFSFDTIELFACVSFLLLAWPVSRAVAQRFYAS